MMCWRSWSLLIGNDVWTRYVCVLEGIGLIPWIQEPILAGVLLVLSANISTSSQLLHRMFCVHVIYSAIPAPSTVYLATNPRAAALWGSCSGLLVLFPYQAFG
jgi:hypothetical protein